jgi:hypothetical protein
VVPMQLFPQCSFVQSTNALDGLAVATNATAAAAPLNTVNRQRAAALLTLPSIAGTR